MEHSPDDAPPLIAAPRHLRRRPFHAEIPDELLVPGVTLLPLPRAIVSPDRRIVIASDSEKTAYRRKRRVALLLVIAVSLSIPALVAALMFAG